jgi:large subunit ribosomal protein L6
MSRVAKIPVVLGKGVEAKIENGFITVKGPKGTLSQKLNPVVEVTIDNGEVHFKAIEPTKFSNAMSGTLRALVNSMNIGVTEGFTKKLNLVGVGYKAQAQGNVLNLSLGFSHPVAYKMPEGIEVKTPTPTEIVIHAAKSRIQRVESPLVNQLAKVAGKRISEDAKIGGITLAMFIFRGR